MFFIIKDEPRALEPGFASAVFNILIFTKTPTRHAAFEHNRGSPSNWGDL